MERHNTLNVHEVLKNGTKEEILGKLQYFESIGANGDSVLHSILRNDKLIETSLNEILNSFLTKGVNPNIKNNDAQTVLHLAIGRRLKSTVDLLLQFNSNRWIEDKDGNTIAHFFIQDEYEKGKLAALYPIMNTPKNRGITEICSMTFLEFLISKNVDFDHKNKQGDSAIHFAIKYYLLHILQILLQYTKENDNEKLLQLLLDQSSRVPVSEYPDESQNSIDSSRYNQILNNLVERSTAKAIASGYKDGCTIISNAIRSNQKMNLIETYIKYFLERCNYGMSKMTLFQELMSTCGCWSDSQTDYYLTILQDLVSFSVNFSDEDAKKELLQTAVKAKTLRPLQFLKDNGVELNLRFGRYESLLHLLAKRGYYEISNVDFRNFITDLLLFGDCQVNDRNNDGNTALNLAICHSSIPMVEILIELDADINRSDDNMRTPLHNTVINHVPVELAELLIKSGADLTAKDSKGDTPLHLAIFNGNVPIALLLIENGVNINCKDKNHKTPLHHAVVKNNSGELLAGLLLASGADINAKDINGQEPLHLAVSNGNLSIVELLIKNGANVNCKDQNQQTPLHKAAVKERRGDLLTDPLLKSGANVNSKDIDGNLPLHLVCKHLTSNNFTPTLKILLEAGAYVTARNNQRETPLFTALSCIGNNNVVYELLKYNADLNDLNIQILLRKNEGKCKIFFDHWIKLAAANLPLHAEYRDYIMKYVDREFFHNMCLEEIELLKGKFLDDGKSLYDFLHMSPKSRCAYIDDKQIKQLIELLRLEKRFPRYSIIIQASYNEAKLRKKRITLMNVMTEIILQLFHISVDNIAEKIVSYLNDEDLFVYPFAAPANNQLHVN